MTDTAAARVPARRQAAHEAAPAAAPAPATGDTDAPVVDLGADWHVHTDLGCGSASAVGMVDAAQAAGLHTVGLSDRVTAATEWLPDYVAMVRSFARPGITVTCGVETAVLDLAGHLDLPAELPELDHVVLVVDSLPTPDGPVRPEAVRAALAARDTTPAAVVDAIVGATVAAVAASPAPVVLGRLFGLLTELGLDDTVVTDDQLDVLATACRAAGARVAIATPATTPSARVATLLAAADVALVAGSDARSPEQVGPHDAAAPVGPATPATALQEIVAADGSDLAAAVHEELAEELEELTDDADQPSPDAAA